MTLDAWMTRDSISAEALGEKLECTGQAVRRYRAGDRMPDPETCDKILSLTGGEVTLADLHNVRLAKLRSTEAA